MKTTVSAAVLSLAVALPGPVAAQSSFLQSAFPASCRSQQVTGAAVGGLVGAFLGRQVADKERRTEGTVLGGAAGAVIGSQLARGLTRCERDLQRAMVLQVAQIDGPVRVPGSANNRAMMARPSGSFVNEQRNTCENVVVGLEDGSAPETTVTVCDTPAGPAIQ